MKKLKVDYNITNLILACLSKTKAKLTVCEIIDYIGLTGMTGCQYPSTILSSLSKKKLYHYQFDECISVIETNFVWGDGIQTAKWWINPKLKRKTIKHIVRFNDNNLKKKPVRLPDIINEPIRSLITPKSVYDDSEGHYTSVLNCLQTASEYKHKLTVYDIQNVLAEYVNRFLDLNEISSILNYWRDRRKGIVLHSGDHWWIRRQFLNINILSLIDHFRLV